VGAKEVEPNVALSVLCFFLIGMAVSLISTILYIYDGIDLETAFGLTVCMINNTGMSFRMAGPEFSCAFLSNFGLLLSSFLMIFGRLEYYAVLALLVPAFWRQD
jgi:trk system potassium uptake protein TrkH